MVNAILHNHRLLRLQGLTLSLGLSLVQKSLLLSSLVLRTVLQQQLEQAGGWTWRRQLQV
jgi:hypothetical protein